MLALYVHCQELEKLYKYVKNKCCRKLLNNKKVIMYKNILLTILFSICFSHNCPDIDPLDYGPCDMWLGWAWSGED